MRIIYISIGYVAQGVFKKLEDKTSVLRDSGIETHLWLVGTPNQLQTSVSTKLFSPDLGTALKIARWPLLWRLYIFMEQYENYKVIRAKLAREKDFDFIILRYPIADFFLWRFMRRYRGKIIFEHNSIELSELEIRKREGFDFKYFYWSEKIFGRWVRTRAAGLIGVTQEITQHQLEICRRKVPSASISNGIKVDRLPKKREICFDGHVLNLLMLTGSAAPWHGVDLLLRSLKNYQGPVKIHLFIAGQTVPEVKVTAAALSNVTLLPEQSGSSLDQLVDQCHIGIGSLGFGESFLKQACTLKVREYWARGLPFVLGYEDSDLILNEEMTPFFLKIKSLDPIDLSEIVSFAERVTAIENHTKLIRDLAFRQIDYAIKVNELVNFTKLLHG